MIAQHLVSGQFVRAVRMVAPFLFDGELRPAGDVVVMPALGVPRRVLNRASFDTQYAELVIGPDGELVDLDDVEISR